MNNETKEELKKTVSDQLKIDNPFEEYAREYKSTVAKNVAKTYYALLEAMYSGVHEIARQWSFRKPLLKLTTRTRFLLSPKDDVEAVTSIISEEYEKCFEACIDEIVKYMDAEMKLVNQDGIEPMRVARIRALFSRAVPLIDESRKRLAKAA